MFNVDLCSADFTIILISFICLISETETSRLIILLAFMRPFKLIRYDNLAAKINGT